MKYSEKLVFPEHSKTPEKRTTITDVAYNLKAVIVHEGENISAGHYICYFKRGETWYYSSDTHVHKSSAFEATSQPAYLLFYEKCAEQEVQEIRYLSKESHHSQMPKAEDNAVREERAHPTKFCIPPGYYKKPSKSFQAGVSPGIYKTAKGNKAWQYSRVDGALIGEAEAIAMAGVQVPQHPRIKGWDPSDVERLLPVEMKVTDGKLSNFLVNQVFLMIEQHSQAANKKIKTVNSDVYNNMAKLSMEVFSKCKYGEIYGDILTADIILCPVLHGDHWCLLVVQLKDKRMVYLDSLFNGTGAQISFSRFKNFLQCMAMYHQLSTDWLGWEFYSIPSSEIAQQTTFVDCGIFVIKWAQHIAEGRPLDFSQMQVNDFRYSLILDIAKGTLSSLSTEPKHEEPSLSPTLRLKKSKIGNCSFANVKQPQQQSSSQQKEDTPSDTADVSALKSTKLTGKADKEQPPSSKKQSPHCSSSNVSSLKTVKTENHSFTSVTQPPKKQPQSDTDSDFESPKKRTKKQVPKEESLTPTPEKKLCSSCCTSVYS